MKNKLLTIGIILLLAITIVIAQEKDKDLETLKGIDEETINEYSELDPDSRNTRLGKTERPSDRHHANSLLTKELIRERFEKSLADGSIKLAIENIAVNAYGKDGDILGSSTYPELIKRLNQVGFDAEFHLETNPDELQIQGFDNLEWSKDGENVIGDGVNWLNLDDLPLGLAKIKFNNGNFELTLKNGNKMTLEGTAVDKEGNLRAFESVKDSEGNSIPLADIIMTSNEGHIKITNDRIKFDPNSEIVLADFKIDSPKKLSGESYIKLGQNGFVTKGVNLNRKNFLKIAASNQDRIINIGNFKEIMHRESILKFRSDLGTLPTKDVIRKMNFVAGFSDPLSTVAKTVKYEDRYPITYDSLNSRIESDAGRNIELQFNEQGNLRSVKTKEGKWLPVTLGTTGDSELSQLYGTSSKFLKEVIDQAKSGGISYEEIQNRFYKDSLQPKEGRTIEIGSTHDNFIIMNGQNLLVGGETPKGEGRITLQRDLNSITGINAKAEIVNGDRIIPLIKGSKSGRYYLGKSNREMAYQYAIDEIQIESNGNFNKKSWTIKDGKLYDSSGTTIAGRSVTLGPYGTSLEASTEISPRDLNDIIQTGKESIGTFSPNDAIVQKALRKEFTARFETNIPVAEGAVLSQEQLQTLLSENLEGMLGKIPDSKLRSSNGKTNKAFLKETVKSMLTQTTGKIKEFDFGSISLEIKNNPKVRTESFNSPEAISSAQETITTYYQGSPDVFISVGNERIPISLTRDQETFFKQSLEAYWRSPDLSKGAIGIGKDGSINLRKPTTFLLGSTGTFYWPPKHLGRLSRDIGTITSGSTDETFLKQYYRKYFGIEF